MTVPRPPSVSSIPAQRVALFGGSFDPPHVGHLAVLRELALSPDFDAVWVVPVFSHPFGKDLAPFETRAEMARLLAESAGSPKVTVSLIEKDLGAHPVYTVDVLTELHCRHPHYEFTLVLGSDARLELPKWRRHEEIERLARLRRIPRRGFEPGPYPEASSSAIRALCREGGDISGLVPPGIRDYIISRRVYG